MGEDDFDSTSRSPTDLQAEVQRRKDWFFECQLRKLNLDSFRNVNETFPDQLLELVSDPSPEAASTGNVSGDAAKRSKRTQLDSGRPIWTIEEREQRVAFKESALGREYGWLDNKRPKKISEKLSALKKQFEESLYSSVIDGTKSLNLLARKDASTDHDLPQATSRVEIALTKPWLIPELYNTPNADATPVDNWIANAEAFVSNYEKELLQVLGKAADTPVGVAESGAFDAVAYRTAVQSLIEQSLEQNSSQFVKVEFLSDDGGKSTFDLKIETAGFPLNAISAYTLSGSLPYWAGAYNLKEIYVNAANADLGLCLLMRAVYLYSNLPTSFAKNNTVRWRTSRSSTGLPNATFLAFFSRQADDSLVKSDPQLTERLTTVEAKLAILLQLSAANPCCASPEFSLLYAEVIKQALLGFKFWMDEPFFAADNHGEKDRDKPRGINKARQDLEVGDAFTEMEYWSENHYIMFASCEYLAGQLWSKESFQPARDFLDKSDKTGVILGEKRTTRGKSRVLKWLNNRLLFGWAEFNSSGYYREHLHALMNLVDFALDDDVRKKALVVIDLLFFDVARFSHRGAMGAAGGRSQFTSKNKGWDNALGDPIEIMLGTRGMFLDSEGDAGWTIATSTYKVPDVFLEIGSFPPEKGFVDRSRVSVTFDDAAKYGIQYSEKSLQRDSIQQGFAPKRTKHFQALTEVNAAIKACHNNYGQMEDDTVFWWTLSAFYNKQTIRNTNRCVDKFKLGESKAFSMLGSVTTIALAVLSKNVLLGTVPFVGPHFLNQSTRDILENAADDLSIFLEGSTRTRANIYTYRNQDVMLSSLQDFRVGQFNVQSNMGQATIGSELNVFTTSGFAGISISDLPFALGGGLGGALGGSLLNTALAAGTGGVITAVAAAGGLVGGVLLNENSIEGSGTDNDGPSWWTGYWALPKIVQHEGAAIIAYDFHWSQRRLADCGSHVLFPKHGFDQVEEQRSSAYDDQNFFLLDITDIGPKGFWLFGNSVHSTTPQTPDLDEESYVAVFSNQRPKWQDKDSDFYSNHIDEKNKKALEDIKNKISEQLDKMEGDDNIGDSGQQTIKDAVVASVNEHFKLKPYISKEDLQDMMRHELSQSNDAVIRNNLRSVLDLVGLYSDQHNHERNWANPLPLDYFADRDWYVDGKNVWIIQVGNKKEYGSFDKFKARVSQAKVEVDDAGDLECVYHIPKPDGSSQALSLRYSEDSELDGGAFQTDLYPRFETQFVRGSLVEWGQREYAIEYRGDESRIYKSLTHDFSDLNNPERFENQVASAQELEIIKALVIHIKTGDENMQRFSIAQATVNVGCEVSASDEIIAAGETEENSSHDVEWIFFDRPGVLAPDMTIEITHPPTSDGDDEPEWKMSFSMKALLGDRRLYDCSVYVANFHFEDERRSTGRIPFTVDLSKWRTWQMLDGSAFEFWQIASQPGWSSYYYYDYFDVLAIDNNGRLRHRKLGACAGSDPEWRTVASSGRSLVFGKQPSICSISTAPEDLFVFTVNNGELFSCYAYTGEDVSEKTWTKLKVETVSTSIFGLPDPTATPVSVPLSLQTQVVCGPSADQQAGVNLYLSGGDQNYYSLRAWLPGDGRTWRKIGTDSAFTPLAGGAFEICGGYLFALDDQQALWAGEIDDSDASITPLWKKLSNDQTMINNFSVACKADVFTILINTGEGEIWSARYLSVDSPLTWERIGSGSNFRASKKTKLGWAVPKEGHLYVFATGPDGKILTTSWSAQEGWKNSFGWMGIDDQTQAVEGFKGGPVAVLSRVRSLIEVFAMDSNQKMWKTWWT